MTAVMQRGISKILSAALSLIILVDGVASSHQQANFWAERKKTPVQLALLPGLKPAFSSSPVSIISAVQPSRRVERIKMRIPPGSGRTLLPIIRALPESAGAIRKVDVPSKMSGRVVIHIQDVHRNLEAQENIGRAVQNLID